MDIKKLITRFRQLGGFTLLREYARIGALLTLVKELVRITGKGLPPKEIYPALERKVQPILRKRYEKTMHGLIEKYNTVCLEQKRSDKIWFCWLQGMENAPLLVKACYESQKRNLVGKKIELISYDTYGQFIELPDYIVKKHKQGKIPHPQFSDLIRLELLIKYGGTWIDSTVLCTGNNFPEKVLDSDLFLFQYRDAQTNKIVGFSNWFITSCTNNRVLLVLREMLYQYWRDYDCVIDYYIFHLFFSMIISECPEELSKMLKNNNSVTLMLGKRITHKYDYVWMKKLTSACAFHKLNYRIKPDNRNAEPTFYDKIIETYIV